MDFNLKGLLQDEEFLLGAGLLSAGSQGQNVGQAVFPSLLQAAKVKKAFGNKQRKIIKGADGYQYYVDTGERVLPDVNLPKKDRKTIKDAAGFQRYADTGERVFPDVVKEIKPKDKYIALNEEDVKNYSFLKDHKDKYQKNIATGQISLITQLKTKTEKDNFKPLTREKFNQLVELGVNLNPNKAYQINENTSEIKQIGSGQIFNIGGSQRVVSAASNEEKINLDLNINDDVTIFKKDGEIVDFKVTSYFDKRLEKISKAVKDSNISEADIALGNIEEFIKALEDDQLPGVGIIEGNLPDFLQSEKGLELRSLITRFLNLELKRVSGAAVTPSEFDRAKNALAGAVQTSDEKVFIKVLKNVRVAIEKQKKQIFAAYRKNDLKQYFESGGLKLYGNVDLSNLSNEELLKELLK